MARHFCVKRHDSALLRWILRFARAKASSKQWNLPIELRRTLDIQVKDALEIYVDGAQIILKKYEPACIFCGNAKDVKNFKGKNICQECLAEMAEAATK